jgi:hypothetical protein
MFGSIPNLEQRLGLVKKSSNRHDHLNVTGTNSVGAIVPDSAKLRGNINRRYLREGGFAASLPGARPDRAEQHQTQHLARGLPLR